MPLEIRKIIFAERELFDAAQLWCRERPDRVPPGELDTGTPNHGQGVRLSLRSRTRKLGRELCLSPAETVEMLARYCTAVDIPIPRLGEKHCRIEQGRLCLVIGLATGWPSSERKFYLDPQPLFT
jgi:hypothetical protein